MTSLEGAGPKQQGIGRDQVHSSSVPSEDKWVTDMEFRIYRESKSLMLNNVMSFLFSLFFHCSIVDLQCCANFCIIAKWLSLADIFFFTFFAIMVYPRTLNTVPCALQEDLLSIHSLLALSIVIVSSLHLLTPNFQSIPLPTLRSLGNRKSVLYVSLFLLCRQVYLPILDFTYKWWHAVFVFLYLTYFT